MDAYRRFLAAVQHSTARRIHMAEQRNAPVNATGANCFKEAVCIDAGRIFDSCTDAAVIIGLNPRGNAVWSFFDV